MKESFLSSVFILLMALSSIHAEGTNAIDGSERNVKPYLVSFLFVASSPVDIQLPNFSLTADSGSLVHGVDIQVSMLPYKSGMMLQSNMENVCLMGEND